MVLATIGLPIFLTIFAIEFVAGIVGVVVSVTRARRHRGADPVG